MNSPAAALTWELWTRHRNRILTAIALLLGFALFYPKLCVFMGVTPGDADAISEIAHAATNRTEGTPSVLMILKIILLLFVALGPYGCLFTTLFSLIVMFTYVGGNPKVPLSFSTRIFTYPVSTGYLATWLMVVGSAAMAVAYYTWTLLVPIPYFEIFAHYMGCVPWITMLLLSQAIVWSLNNFPVTRMFVLMVAFWGMGLLNGPVPNEAAFLARNQNLIMVALSVIAIFCGQLALIKIRHGAWQTWRWTWRLPSLRPALIGPTEFRSVAQAQLWFEWRRHMEFMFLAVVALSVVPFVITALAVMFDGPISDDSQFGLLMYLVGIPLFVHFAYGISSGQKKLSFAMTHPMTNGEMVMAEMKALALSTVLSWMVTLLLLSLLPLLGDLNIPAEMHVPDQYHSLFWAMTPFMVLGLMFLTWRLGVTTLWSTGFEKSWIACVPAINAYGTAAFVGTLLYLARTPEYRQLIARWLPMVLVVLVTLKFLLAGWAFRHALKHQLLARSSMHKYLSIWGALVITFLVPSLLLLGDESGTFSFALVIILLLPLARIGCYPITLNRARHR